MSTSNSYFEHPLIKERMVERRFYQEAIFASSIEKNTLVILPTGLGKTLIAALVAAYRLNKYVGSKCIFLAPTRPLVIQHYNTFRNVMNISEGKIIALTGEVGPKDRVEVWRAGLIFFTTPQILENDLILKRTSISDVSLMVFDEAHRAIGDYPYPYIAKTYMKAAKQPLILGLTASPGSSAEKIGEVSRNLFISNIELRDENSADVKPYIVSTEIDWVKLELPESMADIKRGIEHILRNHRTFLANNGFIDPNSTKFLTKRLLLELQGKLRKMIDKNSGPNNLILTASSIVAEAFRLSHALELLETQGLEVLKTYFDKLDNESLRSGSAKAIKNLLCNPSIVKIRQALEESVNRGLIHPKFDYIVKSIQERVSLKPNSRIIIFCQYRDLALSLSDALNRDDKIKAKRFIGQASREGDKGISQKEQLQILKEFRDGLVNVLVATSVAEEGLDIHECDLVVFYDFSPSVIRYIQRKGRTGRRTPGSVIILLTKGTRDESYYWIVSNKQRNLRNIIRRASSNGKSKPAVESQSRLEKFISGKTDENKIKIIVDHRESSSPVIRELSEMGAEIICQQLQAGDYVVSEHVGIERKVITDFLQSIIDKRLFAQIIKLKENYEIPVLIMEGESLYGLRNIHPNAIRGALTSIAIDYSVPILWSKDPEETAKLIYTAASREQSDRKTSFSLKKSKLAATTSEMQERLLASLPQINYALSKRLLKEFRTPINIFTSSEEELKRVEGLGEKKVKKIKEILNSEYED